MWKRQVCVKTTMLSFFVLSSVLVLARGEKAPCSAASSKDITNGEVFTNNSVIYDGVEYLEGQWFEELKEDNVTLVRRGCICLIKDCLWKCCPDGHAHFGKPCSASIDPRVNPFDPQVYDGTTLLQDVAARDHFLYFYGNPCPDGDRYTLNPSNQRDLFYLQKDGVLYQPGAQASEQYHPKVTYCLDLFEQDPRNPNNTSWQPSVMAVICFGEDADDPEVTEALYGVYAIGLLISVPFLLATLAVYGFVPELRNLHGRCLMGYCFGLLVSYSFLAYLQLSASNIRGTMAKCYVIAFIVFYFFMSSFFWLNVMCFDIWRTFSRYGGKSINPSRERRRFIWYGLYAWGMAAILTAVTALMQFHEGISEHNIKPNFGTNKCWFADRGGELVYFYGPIFILVVVNSVLFGVTAHSILRIRRETAILKGSESARTDQYERDKQRYALYLKLFVVMGVNWTLEVLSFFIKGSDWVWIVTDITNCFLGIFIFVIFVWKNKVRNLLVKRWRRFRHGESGRTPSSRMSSNWTNRDSTTHTDDMRHSDYAQPLRTITANQSRDA